MTVDEALESIAAHGYRTDRESVLAAEVRRLRELRQRMLDAARSVSLAIAMTPDPVEIKLARVEALLPPAVDTCDDSCLKCGEFLEFEFGERPDYIICPACAQEIVDKVRETLKGSTMTTSDDKRRYAMQQSQSRRHACHWLGCTRQVPPALWGCRQHWFRLPKPLRDRIWATYVPGQEVSMTPSAAYLDAADAVDRWVREHGGAP